MMNKTLDAWKVFPFPLIVIVLAFAPYFLSVYYLSLLRTVILWVTLSVSWHLFSGLTKYVALGSAAFFGLGLYFTAKVLNYWPILPFPVVVLLAGLLNFAAALLIGLISLRLKGIYFAIVTFGISEIIRVVFQWWEIRITGTRGTYIPIFFNDREVYYAILITSLAIILLVTFLRKSKFGIALRMIGECEEAAAHTGVNTSIFKTIGFAVSAMCIGLMGASFMTRFTYLDTSIAFDSLYSFLPAVMTLLGGAGTPYGPVLGAVTMSLLSEYLRVTYPHIFLIILGAVLVAIVLFMPNGIMGIVEKLKATQSIKKKLES
ncbi:MAG: branched-chain amino acid ABC transporter permease [Candidatus Bathyarchaeia archaeon]